MKIGISLKIDVTKLDKSRFFTGARGTYVDLTLFIDTDNPGQYGDHGGITQSLTKEERANGLKLPYVGNGKVFWGPQEGQSQCQQQPQQGYQPRPPFQNQQQPQQGYQPQNQGYQNAPMGQPQSGYSQGPQGGQTPPKDDGSLIPF